MLNLSGPLPTVSQIKTRQAARTGTDTSDCTVRAIAATCDISYQDAYLFMAKHGRQVNRGFVIEPFLEGDALAELGYEARKISHVPGTVRYAPVDYPYGAFILLTHRHAIGMVHGTVYDWTAGRLHRIKAVYHVQPLNTQPLKLNLELKL